MLLLACGLPTISSQSKKIVNLFKLMMDVSKVTGLAFKSNFTMSRVIEFWAGYKSASSKRDYLSYTNSVNNLEAVIVQFLNENNLIPCWEW